MKAILSREELAARGLVRVATPWGDVAIRKSDLSTDSPMVKVWKLSGVRRVLSEGGGMMCREYINLTAEDYNDIRAELQQASERQ